jgi:hypothetical protein
MPNIRIDANKKDDLEHLHQQWRSEKKAGEILKPEPLVWTTPPLDPKPYVVTPPVMARITDEFADFLTKRKFLFEIV